MEAGVAEKYDFDHEPFIRLDKSATRADWKYLNAKFLPRDGADGDFDDVLAEIAVFMFCMSPQSGVGVFLGFLFDRIFWHVRRLAHLLLDRYYAENCSKKLKQLLLTDHFCFFLVSLQDHAASALPARQDWTKPHREAESQHDFQLTKKFLNEEYGAEALKANHRLRFHWEGQEITLGAARAPERGYSEFHALVEKYKADGFAPYLDCCELAAYELLKFGISAAEDPPKPDAKQSLRRLVVGFENGDFVDASAPIRYKRFLKGHACSVVANRLFDPAYKLHARPLVDAVHECAEVKDYPMPFMGAVVSELVMFEKMTAAAQDLPKLVEAAVKYTRTWKGTFHAIDCVVFIFIFLAILQMKLAALLVLISQSSAS